MFVAPVEREDVYAQQVGANRLERRGGAALANLRRSRDLGSIVAVVGKEGGREEVGRPLEGEGGGCKAQADGLARLAGHISAGEVAVAEAGIDEVDVGEDVAPRERVRLTNNAQPGNRQVEAPVGSDGHAGHHNRGADGRAGAARPRCAAAVVGDDVIGRQRLEGEGVGARAVGHDLGRQKQWVFVATVEREDIHAQQVGALDLKRRRRAGHTRAVAGARIGARVDGRIAVAAVLRSSFFRCKTGLLELPKPPLGVGGRAAGERTADGEQQRKESRSQSSRNAQIHGMPRRRVYRAASHSS